MERQGRCVSSVLKSSIFSYVRSAAKGPLGVGFRFGFIRGGHDPAKGKIKKRRAGRRF
jgi:hypothetical protein